MCFCERGKFATQVVPFSVQVMALGSANREVNMTAGGVLFSERASCIIISSVEWPRYIERDARIGAGLEGSFLLNRLLFLY